MIHEGKNSFDGGGRENPLEKEEKGGEESQGKLRLSWRKIWNNAEERRREIHEAAVDT